MEATILCPNCGEENPPDLPFCQNCQWRLHPADDPWDPGTSKPPTIPPPDAPEADATTEPVPDWLSRLEEPAGGDSSPQPPSQTQAGKKSDPDADLLAGLASQGLSERDEVPDWVARIMGLNPSTDAVEEPPPQRFPPSGLNSAEGIDESSQLGELLRSEELQSTDDEQTDRELNLPEAHDAGGVTQLNQNEDLSDWLKQLDQAAAVPEVPDPASKPSAFQAVPSWVDDMMGVPDTSSGAPGTPQDTVPEWLLATPPATPSETATPTSGKYTSTSAGNAEQPVSTPSADEPPAREAVETPERVPPFDADAIQRLDVDDLFASMQIPEWLPEPEIGQTESAVGPAPDLEEEDIRTADLPSWVEAMKPPDSEHKPSLPPRTDVPLEAPGPLLGLHGVLPVIPGTAAPISKPRSHAMKLEVSEQHRAHAEMLEALLASETEPLPLRGMRLFGPQRVLRWAISALLLILIGASALSGSVYFAFPSAVPLESNAAIQAVQALPPDAAVLAVFDYEPAVAGEMEAVAASLLDHLLLLKHPRLALLSTSPVGSALAERVMGGVLQDRKYERGIQYVNLGFLPGGLAGVQAFAQDPLSAVPLGAAADRVWDSPVLQGTRKLSDFAAIIVLTESADGGRVWIEQTQASRGPSSFIVISSAQAGPMLLPYFDSGQITGLISGLNGAVGPELANGGLPGVVRSYWDAYSLGLYAATALIVLGAAWHFGIGARERKQEIG